MSKNDIEKGLNDFMNRLIYRQLSHETLVSIPDEKLEQAIFDYVSTKLTTRGSELKDASALAPGFQMVYSTWVLEAEVNNGGFNQFFINSSGQFADMALRYLKMIGATDYYEILQKAIEIRAQEQQNSTLQNLYSEGTVEAFTESYKLTHLGECDTTWYKLTGLSQSIVKYIRMHLDDFVGS